MPIIKPTTSRRSKFSLPTGRLCVPVCGFRPPLVRNNAPEHGTRLR